MMYFVVGPKMGIGSIRPRIRHLMGTTRCVTPSSGRTIVLLGTRTVFSVVSGLVVKIHFLV